MAVILVQVLRHGLHAGGIMRVEQVAHGCRDALLLDDEASDHLKVNRAGIETALQNDCTFFVCACFVFFCGQPISRFIKKTPVALALLANHLVVQLEGLHLLLGRVATYLRTIVFALARAYARFDGRAGCLC